MAAAPSHKAKNVHIKPETVAQRVMAKLGGARQQDRQRGRQAGDPMVEERSREAIDREDQPDRRDDGDDLRRQSPGIVPCVRRTAQPRARPPRSRPDRGGGIRAADDVGPGLRVKLARDPDELEAVLRRQDRLGDGDRVEDTRKEDDREQIMAAGHRDPP